jgi:hypothetical protein
MPRAAALSPDGFVSDVHCARRMRAGESNLQKKKGCRQPFFPEKNFRFE